MGYTPVTEIIQNFDQLFRRYPLVMILCEIILNVDQWFRSCLRIVLLANLFGRADWLVQLDKGNYREHLCYGKCSKISNTLKLRTPKIIAENNF